VQDGVDLLEESYLAMVWAFAEICDTQRAAAVVRSMYNAGRDPRLGAPRLWSLHICLALAHGGGCTQHEGRMSQF
jgi:hypothetical protein